MIANYHTHTPRCHHAYASEEEFCQAAIDGGLKILGFSDHSPYYFPGDYYSNFRMDREQLEDYAQSVFACRDKYAHTSSRFTWVWRRSSIPMSLQRLWTC